MRIITTPAPIVEVMTEDEYLEYVESTLVELVNSDPEAASGHLNRSYYNNPLWLTEERGEIDIFAS